MKSIGCRLGSMVWSAVNWLARNAVTAGWLRARKLPARVISVGNIQAGGAGKTPLVARIAREAHERGRVVAILCRGYGSKWEREGGVLTPGTPCPLASVCGDEAALLHDLAPMAWIGVGADRVRSFEECQRGAHAQLGRDVDLVILDDGFQHWKIQRDVEIVALTSRGREEVLFRESPKALAWADLLVWTKGDQEPEAIRSSGIPSVRIRYRMPRSPSREPIFLVTGIGDGKFARAELEKAGYPIQRHLDCADHAHYDASQVKQLLQDAARSGQRLVVTGKDWVKWRDLGVKRGTGAGDVFVVEPDLDFESGQENWERVIWANG